jgi:hypothetical protein
VKISDLRQIIEGSDSTSDDVRAFGALLAQVDDAELSDFVAAIKAAVQKVAVALAKKDRAAKELESVVTEVIVELERTRLDNTAFKAVVDRIKKTKAINLGGATDIANRFLGSSAVFKSKAEATKALLKRQISDKRASDRQADVSGIF